MYTRRRRRKRTSRSLSPFPPSAHLHTLYKYILIIHSLFPSTRTTAPLDKAPKTRTAPATKKINQAGTGTTQTANDATTNVGKLTNDTVQNIKRTTDSAVGDVATTVKDTGNAIGKRDVRGVGKGVARGETFPRLPFLFLFFLILLLSRNWNLRLIDTLLPTGAGKTLSGVGQGAGATVSGVGYGADATLSGLGKGVNATVSIVISYLPAPIRGLIPPFPLLLLLAQSLRLLLFFSLEQSTPLPPSLTHSLTPSFFSKNPARRPHRLSRPKYNFWPRQNRVGRNFRLGTNYWRYHSRNRELRRQ